MILLYPLIFIVFILLLIVKLAGASFSWGWIIALAILCIVPVIFFLFHGFVITKTAEVGLGKLILCSLQYLEPFGFFPHHFVL